MSDEVSRLVGNLVGIAMFFICMHIVQPNLDGVYLLIIFVIFNIIFGSIGVKVNRAYKESKAVSSS